MNFQFNHEDNPIVNTWDQKVWRRVFDPCEDPVRNLFRYVNFMLEEGRLQANLLSIYITQLLFTLHEDDLEWHRVFEATIVTKRNNWWDRFCNRIPYVEPKYWRKTTTVRAVRRGNKTMIVRDSLGEHQTDLDVIYYKEPVGELQLIRQFRGRLPDSVLEELLRIRLSLTKGRYVANRDNKLYLLPYLIRRGA